MPSDREKEPKTTQGGLQQNDIKDTTKTAVSFFLEGQIIRTNPFGHNVSAEIAYRRSERIVAAIYLITSHVSSNEPLKDILRAESVRLFSLTLDLRAHLRAMGSEKVKNVQMLVRKLISLVHLLGISGYVSLQNVQAIIEALDELGDLLITSQRSTLAEDVVLSRKELVPHTSESGIVNTGKGDAMYRQERANVRNGAEHVQRGVAQKDRIKRTINGTLRSQRILDILRSGGALGIKDIASNLPEYSEKMIQRELAVLVGNNLVSKSGAKRWSKYQIV